MRPSVRTVKRMQMDNLKRISWAAVAALALVATGTTAATASPAIGEPGLKITETDAGFSIQNEDGTPVTVLSEESEIGQTVSYLEDGNEGVALLLELNWLVDDSESPRPQESHADSEPTMSADGNMVITGGVMPEQAIVPDDVRAEPFAAVLSTDSTVQILLSDKYSTNSDVMLDDTRVGTITDGSFVDEGLQSGRTYEYSLSAKSADGNDISLTIPAATLDSEASDLRNKADLDAAVTPYAVPAQQLNTYVHMTYIPENIVNLYAWESLACSGAAKFKGDNRGDVTPTQTSFPSHRTAIRVGVNWQNPAPWQIYWEKSTGPTKKLDGNNNVVATKYADPAGIEVSDTWMSGGVAHFRIWHKVGDPFCIEGSVKYLEDVQFWKSGIVALNGKNNSVPNHEAYVTYNFNTAGSAQWYKLWNQANARYNCLIGWTTNCTKNYTVSRNF